MVRKRVKRADDAILHSSETKNTVNLSDNIACVNDVAASSGINLGSSSRDAKVPLESNARGRVTEDQISSKLAHSSNVAAEDVLVPSTSEEANIAQNPSSCLDLQGNITGDAVDPLLDTKPSAKGQTGGSNDIDEKHPADSLSCGDSDENAHQINGPEKFVETDKHPQISSLESEGDEADLEEQDVKVCDICGDAGREDLLAICSRCSDGAEHTYCMREMLDEVPEGDWLCEECKSFEEIEMGRQRQGHSEILGVKERSKRNSDSLLERKDPSLAGTRADNDSLTTQFPNKRRGSDIEVDPAPKRQVLESMVQSPTASSPEREGSLSRDNSFKNTDKMNAKLIHQPSISGRDGLEKPHSPNANLSIGSKGSFVKSNSFGTSTSKPKVKMAVEIPQKNKQGVETKDASSKNLGKSMPFKGSLSRSNTIESKVKMLSPKDSHILESRGLKQAKDRNLFERKNSIKLDHSSANQLAVNGCKNQPRGEVRRQQSSYPSSGGSSSTNGASGSADAKSSLSLRDGCTSSLSRLDGVNGEKNLERSSNQSRQCIGDGNLQSSALDTSSMRSLKDGVNEENKLKAAIQAAMQKRLDMSKKSKGPDKSNVVSVSNVDSVGEKATLDRPNSMNSRNSVSAEGMHEAEAASRICSFNGVKEASVDYVNQSKVFPADSFHGRNMDLVSSDVENILSRSSIPEHEFAWIGSFEVYRGGSPAEQISGIQAHLSTCASDKVLEMVKKFPQKVSLSEVPRSCTWPVQFQDGGAEEDNIAVYFFAKDVESYERSYKNLLEKMMKDDLALKGNIDGIDLLIFPSKQLTKRSQRWNMLFFIWGVFRGRTENCLDNKSGHVKKLDLSSLNTDKGLGKPSLWGSIKENICTTKCDQDVGGPNVFASGVALGKESPSITNGNRYLGEQSPHKASSYVMKKPGHHEIRNESLSTCYHQEASCGIGDRHNLVQPVNGDPDSVKVAECQTSSSRSGGGDSSVKAENVSGDQNPAQEATSVGGSSEELRMAKAKGERSQMIIEGTLKDEGCRIKLEGDLNKDDTSGDAAIEKCQTRLQDNLRQEEQCKEKEMERGKVILECELKQEEADRQESEFGGEGVGYVKMEDVIDQQQLLQRKNRQEDCTGSLMCPTIVGQKRPLSDMNVAFDGGDEETVKERVGSSILFCGHDTTTTTHDVHSARTVLEKRYKAVSDRETPSDSALAETERFFFPVDSHPSGSIQSRDDSLPSSSKAASTSLGTDDHLTDGFPNLELALGVENRMTKSGCFLGLVDDHRFQLNSLDAGRRKEDEEASAALSLSLAFPFADKQRSASGAAEQAFPEREPDK